MEYTIQEIGGKLYEVFPTGSRLLHKERPHPAEPGIYVVTHIPTSKKYVGSTMNLMKRSRGYNSSSKTGLSRFKSLPGKELKFEVLEVCLGIAPEDLLQLELSWILKLNTVCPIGFNDRNPTDLTKFSGAPAIKYNITKPKRKYYDNPKPFPF